MPPEKKAFYCYVDSTFNWDEGTKSSIKKVSHIKQLPLDLKAIMDGLSSLLLPSQSVIFSPYILHLSEDPALAMAFSVAKRAAAVPHLLVNGTYRKSVRSYLDSAILQHQLQRLNDHGSLKGFLLCNTWDIFIRRSSLIISDKTEAPHSYEELPKLVN